MKPYSNDLRRKAIAALDEDTSNAVGERFGIAGSCIRKWRLRLRAGGSLEPRKPPGREREFDATHDAHLKEAVGARPDATRAELARAVGEKVGRIFSESSISRALKRLGLTRKKRLSQPASSNAPTFKPLAKTGSLIQN